MWNIDDTDQVAESLVANTLGVANECERMDEPVGDPPFEAERETEVALTDTRHHRPGDSALSHYFRQMSDHPVLQVQQETEAAQALVRLQIGYWRALLAYGPAFETLAVHLRTALSAVPVEIPTEIDALQQLAGTVEPEGELTATVQDQWDRLAIVLADKLWALDTDRLFVEQANRAVQCLAGACADELDLAADRRVKITCELRQYLADVDAARVAQQVGRNRFVTANLRLVVSIARRVNRGRLPLSDLIQEGNIGLLKAVERFDHTRNCRFSTYASWWIRRSIDRAVADKGRIVRIPVHMLSSYHRVERASRNIRARTGQEPSAEQIEQETGVAPDKLDLIKDCGAAAPFSLERPVNDDDGCRYVDFLEGEDVTTPLQNLENKRWTRDVQRLLGTLTPIEASIVRWRFGLDDHSELSLQQIGEKSCLSRHHVRQLQDRALHKIRRQLTA